MAKKRLVDFRGGVNQKISPHMIGDSQGQTAQDVDLSAVRLQGRKKLNTSDTAKGDFFYATGNIAGIAGDGRWVSTLPIDGTGTGTNGNGTYESYAQDFAVWNRDLYVAVGSGHASGEVQRFLDGNTQVAGSLTLNPPTSVTVTGDYPYSSTQGSWVNSTISSSRGGKGHQLTAAIAEVPYIAEIPFSQGTPVQVATTLIATELTFTGAYIYGFGFAQGQILNATQLVLWSNDSTKFASSTPFSSYVSSEPTPTGSTVYYGFHTGAGTPVAKNTPTTINQNMLLQTSTAYPSSTIAWQFSRWQSSGQGSYGNASIVRASTHPSTGATLDVTYSGTTYYAYLVTHPSGLYNYFPYHSTTITNIAKPMYILWSNALVQRKYAGTTTVYQGGQQYVPGQAFVPGTPAFTSDDARFYIYRQFTSSDQASSSASAPIWNDDAAEGASPAWLGDPTSARSITSSTDDGYYLSAITATGGSLGAWTGLPEESQGKTKATAHTNNKFVFGQGAVAKPQRLNFSVTPDQASLQASLIACYRLFRVDSNSTAASSTNLGFILPSQVINMTINGNAVTFSGTDFDTTGNTLYKLNWTAYQNTEVSITGSTYDGTSVTATSPVSGKSSGTIGTNGALFVGSSYTITLSHTDNDTYVGVDFWLEKRVIGTGAYNANDTFAVVRSFDYFKYSSTSQLGGSDFLDVFASGLSSGGGLGSSASLTAPPTYLKFLKESNNFFFGVGTDDTEPERYGGQAGVNGSGVGNKADSFLFVSSYNNPRDWPYDGYVEFDASITGLATYPGELIVFTESGTYRVTGSRANQMRKSKLATTEGLKNGNHKSIALVGNNLVWVSQSGICFYNGNSVTNLTQGRYQNFIDNFAGTTALAGQLDGKYYVIRKNNETGYVVDFTLEGFPISEIDLKEDQGSSSDSVLVYVPHRNKLYTRKGFIEGSSARNSFSYKTREFDGGSFGSLKLVKNVTLNGTGSGKVQVYLDKQPILWSDVIPNSGYTKVLSTDTNISGAVFNTTGVDLYYLTADLTATTLSTVYNIRTNFMDYSSAGIGSLPDYAIAYSITSVWDLAINNTNAIQGAFPHKNSSLTLLQPTLSQGLNLKFYQYMTNTTDAMLTATVTDGSNSYNIGTPYYPVDTTLQNPVSTSPYMLNITPSNFGNAIKDRIIVFQASGSYHVFKIVSTAFTLLTVPGAGGANIYAIQAVSSGILASAYTLDQLPSNIKYWKDVSIDPVSGSQVDQPARIYLPAARTNNPYGLSVADTWSVEVQEWSGDGQIDWIETEYETLAD